MDRLGDLVTKVRSKNAGPFWLTVDVFCGSRTAFDQVAARLDTARVAAAFAIPEDQVKRFDIADLNVIKVSLPRPATQGAINDRDMHGASWAVMLAELEI